MTDNDKYKLLIYAVHSFFESNRNDLIVEDSTTVENFRDNEVNNKKCLEIHKFTLEEYNYDLSWNQVANAINLFLQAMEK